MKRILIIAVVLVYVLTVAACTAEVNQHGEQKNYCFDYNKTDYMTVFYGTRTFETDDAVYLLRNNILYFSDKVYKEWLPLCARPNCPHDSVDCDASVLGSISIYGEYIYYFEYNSPEMDLVDLKLYRMRLDGTQHEKVCDMPVPDVGFTPQSDTMITGFTDKYVVVYYTAVQEDTSDGEQVEELVVASKPYVFSLDTNELVYVDFPSGFTGLHLLAGMGAGIYCTCVESEPLTQEFYLPTYLAYLDLETGELSIIGKLTGNMYDMEGNYMFVEDRFMYMDWDSQNKQATLYQMDLNTGECQELARESTDTVKWWSADWVNKYFFSNYRRANKEYSEEFGFYVYDQDLNLVDSFLYADLSDEENKLSIARQTESYIFAIEPNEHGSFDSANGIPLWYIDKADIGTGNLQWRRWEP